MSLSSTDILPRQISAFSTLQKARMVFALGVLFFLLVVDFFSLPLILPFPLLIQAALFYLLMIVLFSHLQRRRIHLLRLIKYSLLLDVLVLTELLIFTGGSSNPLTFLYFLPILTAALMCSRHFAWSLAALAIGAYLVLFFWHWPFPIVVADSRYLLNIHLTGMWVTFALSTVLITLWVSNLATAIRIHARKLAKAHEKQQEREYWLALGMEAAGMAHHLSTPINNMILIADEMINHPKLPETLRDDVDLLEIQLQECTDTLRKLKESGEFGCRPIALYATLAEHLVQWHNLRPDARCTWHRLAEEKEDYMVLMDDAFWLALLNILNNAADAGDGRMDMYTTISDTNCWEVGIHNRSGFLSSTQLKKAGLDILESDKPSGLGLGVRLSHATLSRLSGSLTLENHAQGGVFAKIVIPLNRCDSI